MPVNISSDSGFLSVYRERAYLVSFLTTIFPSVGIYDNADEPEYMLVYVETPVGQMSWHIHPDDIDLFEGLYLVSQYTWDGHSTREKYDKLQELTMSRRVPSGKLAKTCTPGRALLDGLLAEYGRYPVRMALSR